MTQALSLEKPVNKGASNEPETPGLTPTGMFWVLWCVHGAYSLMSYPEGKAKPGPGAVFTNLNLVEYLSFHLSLKHPANLSGALK